MTFDDYYLNLVDDVLTTGELSKNRTGIDTLYKNGLYMEFDMEEGFPLLTTKRVPWKSAFGEMLGFIRGYTNAADFRKLGSSVWDKNADWSPLWNNNPLKQKDGDLQRIYGYRWRNWHNWTEIFPKKEEKPIQTPPVIIVAEQLPIIYSTSPYATKVGNEYETKMCGKLRVVEYLPETSRYKVQFLRTGYIKEVETSELSFNITRCKIKDPYYPSWANMGVQGEKVSKELTELLLPTWRQMLNRCYAPSQIKYNWYINSWVCDRWLEFEKFVEDAQKLPRWHLKVLEPNNYTLDKDYLGGKHYSPSTCRWSTRNEQAVNSSNCSTIKITNSKGEYVLAKGIPQIAEILENKCCLIQNCLNKTQHQSKGHAFEYVDNIVSYSKVDQLKEVYAKINNNYDDRRLIIEGWHPAELDMQALPVCHKTMQFGLSNNNQTLDLFLHVRSNDIGLGMPFNVAQYAWLLHLMAKITNHKPGKLCYFAMNYHIYVNHIDALKEQLTRIPKESPEIMLSNDVADLNFLETTELPISDWTNILNYNPYPSIKMEMAV